LEILEGNAAVHGVLGALYAQQGRAAEAETHLRRSLALRPRNNKANGNLATLCLQSGRTAEAVRLYRFAVEDDPRDKESLNNLAWLLAAEPGTSPAQAREALALARRAVELAPDGPDASQLDTLALAQAASSDFAGAAATAEQALAQAEKEGNPALGREIQGRWTAYRAGKQPRLQGGGEGQEPL
jgi:Flp pilus assembly protein TadD